MGVHFKVVILAQRLAADRQGYRQMLVSSQYSDVVHILFVSLSEKSEDKFLLISRSAFFPEYSSFVYVEQFCTCKLENVER